MTYKLNHDLRKIQSPEVLVHEGKETEYPNCAAVTELLFKEKYGYRLNSARTSFRSVIARPVLKLVVAIRTPSGKVRFLSC